jgi:iron complex transport system substrate-binding protein
MNTTFKSKALTVILLLWSGVAQADRMVTDQLGRQVKVPDKVNRVVVLQHQTLDILVQLGVMDKVVGVLQSWNHGQY